MGIRTLRTGFLDDVILCANISQKTQPHTPCLVEFWRVSAAALIKGDLAAGEQLGRQLPVLVCVVCFALEHIKVEQERAENRLKREQRAIAYFHFLVL